MAANGEVGGVCGDPIGSAKDNRSDQVQRRSCPIDSADGKFTLRTRSVLCCGQCCVDFFSFGDWLLPFLFWFHEVPFRLFPLDFVIWNGGVSVFLPKGQFLFDLFLVFL